MLKLQSKDIKKLSRADLIEIIYSLKKSEEALQEQVEALRAELDDRTIKLEKLGSVAEAAIAVSGVFDAAQSAADTYLDEVKRKHSAVDAECIRMIAEAQRRADAIVKEAQAQRDSIEQQCAASRTELRRMRDVLLTLADEFSLDR